MSTVPIPRGATIGDVQASVPIPEGATIGDSSQPGFAARASQQIGLTQHPIDQLISELTQLKNHPIDTLWETVKQPVIGLRDLANNLVRHPIDTVQQVTGGKQFAQDVQSGNYSGALGTLAGAGAQAAMMKGPKITATLPSAAEGIAERTYQSALKPPPGSYTSAEVGSMVKTGLENQIPVSAEGAEKLGGLIKKLNQEVKGQIQQGSKQGVTIDPNAVATRADQVGAQFQKQVNKTGDLAAIQESKSQFLKENPNPLPAADAQDIKSGTYNQLRKKYGEMGSASTETQKALARGIKEELEGQFPEIKNLNAREAKLIGLDEALDRAVRRISNRDLFSLGGKIVVAGAGTIAGLETGHGVLGAASGLLAHHIMTDPTIQSKLAIAINTGAKGGITFGGASAKVAGYASALNRAASASASDSGARASQ